MRGDVAICICLQENAGLILGLYPTDKGRRYKVTPHYTG